MNIPIVYEDDWLLVVDKPAGLLTIPTPKNENRTLTGIINEEFKSRKALFNLYPCHRLDRETSGLIIYAKGKSAQKKMFQAFKDRQVKKKYIAFLSGNLSKSQGRIAIPIEGVSAITVYKVIKQAKDYAVVEVMPLTGRTNQIRIHFKQTGHPLLGETKYAFRRDFKIKARRLCLHAAELEFTHPVTKKNLKLSCALPEDMQEFLTLNNPL